MYIEALLHIPYNFAKQSAMELFKIDKFLEVLFYEKTNASGN